MLRTEKEQGKPARQAQQLLRSYMYNHAEEPKPSTPQHPHLRLRARPSSRVPLRSCVGARRLSPVQKSYCVLNPEP